MSAVSFIVYHKTTGRWLSWGSVDDTLVSSQKASWPNAGVIRVDEIPSGFFLVDVTKADGRRRQPYVFADVTIPREPTEAELSQPDDDAARSWSAIVNAERERRLQAGAAFDGISAAGSDRDMTILTSLALGAQMRIAEGDTTTPTIYRDANNVDHELTPVEVVSLWRQAAAYVSALYAASWAIKAMAPVPANVADDGLWP